jgi:hypothetical protein
LQAVYYSDLFNIGNIIWERMLSLSPHNSRCSQQNFNYLYSFEVALWVLHNSSVNTSN